MTPKTIHLHKLLKLFGLSDKKLTTELRKELRNERRKLDGISEGGGDFHVPFWADAKLHVIGFLDLKTQTALRVAASDQRKRLYPRLQDGFLEWLEGIKRRTNEKVGWHEVSVHNHFAFPSLELTLKVDNLLSLAIGTESYRLVYPYFCEMPVLS